MDAKKEHTMVAKLAELCYEKLFTRYIVWNHVCGFAQDVESPKHKSLGFIMLHSQDSDSQLRQMKYSFA